MTSTLAAGAVNAPHEVLSPVVFLDRLASSAGGALLEASWQAAILALVVGGICVIAGNRISSFWRCALWLVVFARLLMPWTPQSAVSMFNIAKPWWRESASDAARASPPSVFGWVSADQLVPPSGDLPMQSTRGLSSPTLRSAGASQSAGDVEPSGVPRTKSLVFWLLLGTWLVGAIAVLVLLLAGHLRLRRFLRESTLLGDARVAGLLDRSRELLHVRFPVTLTENARVQTPLLIGVIRPALVLPQGLASQMTEEELRDVLLHELAHVKRHDILVSWVMSLVLVVHWFNPIAWIAASRWRAERELACDELVLKAMTASRRPHYGRTLLKLVEHTAVPTSFPAVAGIVENNSDLKRRIAMIAGFRTRTLTSSLIAGVALTLALAAGLTNAQTREARPAAATPKPAQDAEKPASPFRQGASDVRLYTRAYKDDEGKDSVGRTMWTLPKETTLEVLPEYRGQGENGKKLLDTRITIVAQDRANQFWAMIASLENEDARLLRDELDKAVSARKTAMAKLGLQGDDRESIAPRIATWDAADEFGGITLASSARLAVSSRSFDQPILLTLSSAPAGLTLRSDFEIELRVSRASRLLAALTSEIERRASTAAASTAGKPTSAGAAIGRERIADHFMFTKSGIKANEYGVLELSPQSVFIVSVNENATGGIDPRVSITLKDASGATAMVSRLPVADAAALGASLQELIATKKAAGAKPGDGGSEIVVAAQKYEKDAAGMAHIAARPFKVLPRYLGVKQNGERITDDRVTMIVEDREIGFWPLVARLDLAAAEKLAIDLTASSANSKKGQ